MNLAVTTVENCMSEEPLRMLGCGILKKEIQWLTNKNGWQLNTSFLDSMLHVDFNALATALRALLSHHAGERKIVFYGACHPLMELLLEEGGAIRTPGQNCVEMLLGNGRFMQELGDGAYFLLEEWALRWDYMITKTFGTNDVITRDIFRGDRSYLLCVRTPCSGDFTEMAEAAGKRVGLPLRWMDVSLDHLETVLQATIDAGSKAPPHF